ncbi:mitochondrial amidoxime reducing component 2-like [Clytia hemisphaerica]|uniref:MOSC domain-containing protein n=1 Tax=Clytia hemisphaerica TaxID=252671 RepID=A0A7M5X571_9CNID
MFLEVVSTKLINEQRLYICLILIPLVYIIWRKITSSPPRRRVVGYVKEIRTHPVKSCKPYHVKEIEVSSFGLEFDRQFALLNEYGTFVTLRKYPKFVLIDQEILGDEIRLRAEGMPDLRLPLKMTKKDGDHVADVTVWSITAEGVHVSQEADDWFAEILNLEGCRLYCFPSDGVPRKTKVKNVGQQFDMMFPDGCPLLITSEASLSALNMEYSHEDIVMDRFRPNIVLGGCSSYQEDVLQHIQIGDHAVMKGLWACERCVAINVDTLKGEKSSYDLLKFLTRTRPGTVYNPKVKGGIFGYNYGVLKPGIIKLGDPVYQLSS